MSPIVNTLVLGLVPVSMFLAGVFSLLGWIPVIGKLVAWLLYVPLEIFVKIVELFGR